MESHPQPNTIPTPGHVVLECPQCLGSCSPADDECTGCGFRFRAKREAAAPAVDRTIHFDPVTKKRYSDAVIVQVGTRTAGRSRFFWMATNLVLGAITASIGGFMAYAMPFGFECGMIFVFVGALFMLNVYLTSEGKYTRIDGCCPNCGADCSMPLGKKKTTGTDRCQKCSSAFHYDGSRFEEA